jgi:uncharacterized delta-60 repeat protein
MLRLLPTLLLLLVPAAAEAAPADVDRGFGSGGQTIVDFGGDDESNATAIQPDGKIVVAGSTSINADAVVARLNADGSPDLGFGGGDGIAVVEGAAAESLNAIEVQPDGKIVAAGSTSAGINGIVYRLNTDGSPDKGFGTDGAAVIDSGGAEYLTALALAPDGRIVVAGYTSVDVNIAVYRLTAEGKPDNTFDDDGARGINALGEDWGHGVAVQSDGGVVVVGGTRGSGQIYPVVARLDALGKPDNDFGPGSWRVAGANGYYEDVALQPDGRIVAIGDTWIGDDAAVDRYDTAGRPDRTFAGDGTVGLDLGADEEAYDVAVQRGGKIVVGGYTEVGRDGVVWRLEGDGSLDRGFGEGGAAVVAGGGLESVAGLAIQRDAKIVLVGERPSYDADALVTRLVGDFVAPPPPQAGGQGAPAPVVRCAGLRATIVGTPGRDVLRVTRGRDVIAALGGDDVVRGLAGDDVVCAGAGNDRVAGGAGRDRLFGGAGRDRLVGGPGRDRLVGGPGRDRLIGGPGRDRVS